MTHKETTKDQDRKCRLALRRRAISIMTDGIEQWLLNERVKESVKYFRGLQREFASLIAPPPDSGQNVSSGGTQ